MSAPGSYPAAKVHSSKTSNAKELEASRRIPEPSKNGKSPEKKKPRKIELRSKPADTQSSKSQPKTESKTVTTAESSKKRKQPRKLEDRSNRQHIHALPLRGSGSQNLASQIDRESVGEKSTAPMRQYAGGNAPAPATTPNTGGTGMVSGNYPPSRTASWDLVNDRSNMGGMQPMPGEYPLSRASTLCSVDNDPVPEGYNLQNGLKGSSAVSTAIWPALPQAGTQRIGLPESYNLANGLQMSSQTSAAMWPAAYEKARDPYSAPDNHHNQQPNLPTIANALVTLQRVQNAAGSKKAIAVQGSPTPGNIPHNAAYPGTVNTPSPQSGIGKAAGGAMAPKQFRDRPGPGNLGPGQMPPMATQEPFVQGQYTGRNENGQAVRPALNRPASFHPSLTTATTASIHPSNLTNGGGQSLSAGTYSQTSARLVPMARETSKGPLFQGLERPGSPEPRGSGPETASGDLRIEVGDRLTEHVKWEKNRRGEHFGKAQG